VWKARFEEHEELLIELRSRALIAGKPFSLRESFLEERPLCGQGERVARARVIDSDGAAVRVSAPPLVAFRMDRAEGNRSFKRALTALSARSKGC